jgi:hypothetical protein
MWNNLAFTSHDLFTKGCLGFEKVLENEMLCEGKYFFNVDLFVVFNIVFYIWKCRIC